MALERKFLLAQTAALLQLGIAPQDVERSLRWLERTLPPNADPATWLPSEQDLALGVDEVAVADARTDWYARAPNKWKRLLDARLVQ